MNKQLGWVDRFDYAKSFARSRVSALSNKIFGTRIYSNVIGCERALSANEGGGLISKSIESGRPFVAGRMGTTELKILHQAIEVKLGFRKEFTTEACEDIKTYSGVFPVDQDSIHRFSSLMFDSLRHVDLLAQLGHIDYVKKTFAPEARFARLHCLEPYYLEDPWSSRLVSKKVLVVHPFSSTIESQYLKRGSLFENDVILPEFELVTYAPVQSVALAESSFSSWFDALDAMTNDISKIDFDVAIVGAGAYGLPLAVRLKGMGKIAIHVAGATQVLFGIKGKRWDNHPIISKMYNEHWVRPSESERPVGFQMVEGGCYW